MNEGQEGSGRRKTSKYFARDKQKPNNEMETENMKSPPGKRSHELNDDDDDFVLPNSRKNSVDVAPSKKLKGSLGRGVVQKPVDIDKKEDDEVDEKNTISKSGGRGRGGRGGASAPAAGGRGRGGGGGGGRGGFMNFGERKDPPHKGEKVCFSVLIGSNLVFI